MNKLIGKYLTSNWSLKIIVFFYIVAGFNHFEHPSFYLPLIPPSFPEPNLINILSGIFEILLGIGLAIRKTREPASYLVILMLLAFIPSHIYFIEIGSCVQTGLCVPEWFGWTRLIIIHPFLIYWVWVVGKFTGR